MTNAQELLGALSDPTRHAVLDLLRRQPSTVGELAGRLPVSRPAVSQHLRVLKSAGLVQEERRGTRHYFRLDPQTLEALRTHVDSLWKDALNAFSDFAKKETHAKNKRRNRTDPAKRRGRLSH